ncbi:hypothetical protein CCMA1212_001386 [Trichoderma ghanense]|uniref:Uncharacterized protein n=1 Tax=Trichoderma ghanense TaxID=65468 RepID=A0ABY2HF61_9HYPO
MWDCPGLIQIMYLSTLPYGCIPNDPEDLFHQFLTHTKTQWLALCHRAEESLTQRRFDQLKSQGKSPEIMNDLAQHAQKLASLRLNLTGQISAAKNLMDDPSMKNFRNSGKGLLKFLEEDFEPGILNKLDELDQMARDLLQIEFAWTSIHEARMSTKLGQNVMLLTYVSIFYLPLGFCAVSI